MAIRTWVLAVAGASALAACGDDFKEQGLLGAGAGVATALVLDGSPVTGAIVGAAGNVLFCQTNPGKCN